MGGSRGSRRTRGPRRGARPGAEPLDGRILLSASPFTARLGPFIEPGALRPRIRQTPTVVDASAAANRHLVSLLGPEDMGPILGQAAARGVRSQAMLYDRVLHQPFVSGILGSLDTYALLNSPATQSLVGFIAVDDSPTIPTAPESVPFTVSASDILALTPTTATVQIPPASGRNGFLATVPIAGLRPINEGIFEVDVPADQIPGGATPPPQTRIVGTGALSDVYSATGPVLTQALLTGRHRTGPNAPAVVRGLRLIRGLGDPRIVPPGTQANYIRLLRVAVERNAFQPTPAQSGLIADGLEQFLIDVGQFTAAGTFTPPIPPATPPNLLGGATLGGTLQVTTGAVRDLVNVAPSQAGLPLFGLSFPGRIDAGFVIAANGDYGLVLSARGPYQDAPAGFASDVVGGDLRVELSNAPTLSALDGLRVEEGTFVGAVASGAVAASRTPLASSPGDLVTLAASPGFGTGLDFGTAVSLTRVIPLGNLNALLPQFPRA